MLSLVRTGACSRRNGGRWWSRAVAVACLVASFDTLAVVPGGGIALYEAQSGVLPTDPSWGWTYGTMGAGSTTQVSGGVLGLDTTASTGQAGYNLYNGANLDSTAGFALDFSFKLDTESHASANRSGFSIIVLDQAANGIELSFWTNKVWAKNADAAFSHSAIESISVDTTVDRTYRLTFLGSTYSLSTNGAPALTGALRRYHYSSGDPLADAAVNSLVYDRMHYVFFGDNTTAAAAKVALGAVMLAPVPEPGEWVLMLAGLGGVAAAMRRRARMRPR